MILADAGQLDECKIVGPELACRRCLILLKNRFEAVMLRTSSRTLIVGVVLLANVSWVKPAEAAKFSRRLTAERIDLWRGFASLCIEWAKLW
jgi:hypothetical protein